MNAFNFEGGEIEEISKFAEKDGKKDKKFEIQHYLKGYFNENQDGTIDIKTENGVLEKVSKDILPEDLKGKEQGELIITFTHHDELSIKILNKLLKGDENG